MKRIVPNTDIKLYYILLALAFSTVLLFMFPSFFSLMYNPFQPSHASMHLIVEMISIFVSFSIAIHAWVTHKEGGTVKFSVLLAGAFLAVGTFDTFHALTFVGMPTLFIESSPLTSAWFWIMARLTESIVLTFVIIFPTLMKKVKLSTSYLFFTVFSLLTTYIVFAHHPSLPTLIMDGAPTTFKISLEAVGAVLHAVVIMYVLFIYKDKFKHIMLRNLYVIGSFSLILSSIFFMRYEAIDAYLNMAGHIYKIIGYAMFFIILYLLSVRAPFQKIHQLHERNRMMFNMIELGIVETDAKGKISYMNEYAKQLLEVQETEGLDISQFESKSSNYFEYEEIVTLSEKKIPVEFDRFPLIDHKKIDGYVYTLRDLREAIENEELSKEKAIVDYEIETAASIQQDFYLETPYCEKIGVVSIPFKRLNGDFHNILQGDDVYLVTIADIVGKGIPAAIQTSLLIGAIENVNLQADSPKILLRNLNKVFTKYSKSENFLTLMTLHIDTKTGVVRYASAGHEPAIHYHAKTNTFSEINTKGPAIGFFEDSEFHEQQLQLEKGDLILLYTDGLIEDKSIPEEDIIMAMKKAIESVDRTKTAEEMANEILEKITKARSDDFHDDRTIIIIKG
ncbi:SpoIIE family protein phosphatase [Bacillus sp. FJAT-45066]|uniref:SpoIIE family protein phosphatase n=1 Tax=Bacillus sp. FJAT-45066 TaxID=2011010 RepID=UPI000BB8A1A8|nr:SpoIIE family protein phosphatase [Bacillus sp. FJAT-45066]